MRENERWKQLCQQAATEQEPRKLLELTRGLGALSQRRMLIASLCRCAYLSKSRSKCVGKFGRLDLFAIARVKGANAMRIPMGSSAAN